MLAGHDVGHLKKVIDRSLCTSCTVAPTCGQISVSVYFIYI